MNDKAKSPGADLTLEQVEALVTRAPYHKWLGLKVIAVHDDEKKHYGVTTTLPMTSRSWIKRRPSRA